jgi:hypothetical protein
MPLPIKNPLDAFGASDIHEKLWSNEVPFEASGVVTSGYVVAIGTDGTVVNATATQGTTNVMVGVAAESATTGQSVLVVTEGYANIAIAPVDLAANVAIRASTGGLVGVTTTVLPAIGTNLLAITSTAASGAAWISKKVV